MKDTLGYPIHTYEKGPRAEYTWSARFEIDPPLKVPDVLQRLHLVVNAFRSPIWPISGAVVGSGAEIERTALVLGLDPSRTFDTPSKHQNEILACAVSDICNWWREDEELPEVRLIMGRRRGYQQGAAEYSTEDVRTLVTSYNCAATVQAADLFSLRYVPDQGIREYTEPGVIVGCTTDDLPRLLNVAYVMGQERVVPEITGIQTQVYYRS